MKLFLTRSFSFLDHWTARSNAAFAATNGSRTSARSPRGSMGSSWSQTSDDGRTSRRSPSTTRHEATLTGQFLLRNSPLKKHRFSLFIKLFDFGILVDCYRVERIQHLLRNPIRVLSPPPLLLARVVMMRAQKALKQPLMTSMTLKVMNKNLRKRLR